LHFTFASSVINSFINISIFKRYDTLKRLRAHGAFLHTYTRKYLENRYRRRRKNVTTSFYTLSITYIWIWIRLRSFIVSRRGVRFADQIALLPAKAIFRCVLSAKFLHTPLHNRIAGTRCIARTMFLFRDICDGRYLLFIMQCSILQFEISSAIHVNSLCGRQCYTR